MIVIYHKNCFDGFTAAWLLWHNLPKNDDHTFIPCQYGEYPITEELVKGKDVVIADFSFDAMKLGYVKEFAKSLIVLDHHKTAQAALEGLDYCKFDMTKSGARMVQEHFGYPNHWLVDYTEDRDLWLHKLPNTKEINAAIRLTPFDFNSFEELSKKPLEELILQGRVLLAYEEQLIQSAVNHAEEVTLAGHKVLKVNTTVLHSEIGNRLCINKDGTIRPFAMTYFCTEKEIIFSLRSTDQGEDVSVIAKMFGGGGHRNAAGFKIINGKFDA